jgi:hypothetical protein
MLSPLGHVVEEQPVRLVLPSGLVQEQDPVQLVFTPRLGLPRAGSGPAIENVPGLWPVAAHASQVPVPSVTPFRPRHWPQLAAAQALLVWVD